MIELVEVRSSEAEISLAERTARGRIETASAVFEPVEVDPALTSKENSYLSGW